MSITEAIDNSQTLSDPLDRLEIFGEVVGFLPTSTRELSEAMSLLNFPAKAGGTARHLNEILIHQQAAETDDPARAVRRVADQYAGYFKGARLDYTHLLELNKQVEETDNPKLSLAEATGSDIGFGALIRYLDLAKLAKSKQSLEPEANPLKSSYTVPTPETQRRIDAAAARLIVRDLRLVVPAAIEDQRSRGRFWRERLIESKRHALARPIAIAALS